MGIKVDQHTVTHKQNCISAFIGYAKDIVAMINHRPINDMESDQLYFTEIFVNKELRVCRHLNF